MNLRYLYLQGGHEAFHVSSLTCELRIIRRNHETGREMISSHGEFAKLSLRLAVLTSTCAEMIKKGIYIFIYNISVRLLWYPYKYFYINFLQFFYHKFDIYSNKQVVVSCIYATNEIHPDNNMLLSTYICSITRDRIHATKIMEVRET